MTDSQVKYQQVMEAQRHNLAMEKLGAQENVIKQQQANIAERQADASALAAQASYIQAEKARKRTFAENFRDIAGALFGGLASTGSFMNSATGAVKNVTGALSSASSLFK